MEKLFTVQDNFSETVSRYVSREMGKGKDPVRTMNRIMGYWLLNAMKSIQAPKSSREQIRAYLMQKVADTPMPATRRKRAKVVDEMRNTIAMLIVAKRNYKGFRSARGSDGYKIARNFRNQSTFSSGYIKSGFLPGLRARRVKSDGSKTPPYKNPPGDSPAPIRTANEITMQVSNFANMVAELFPNAFEQGAQELSTRLTGFLMADMIAEQNAAGLNAKSA